MIQTNGLQTTIQDFLSQMVQGRTVLDVGCVDHSASIEQSSTWLHKHLVRTAESVVGLDILESEAQKLRQRGYNVVAGDATTVSLGRTFDFVVAGEIIEHVDNPSAFVANMARHLNDNGRLVITTPNAFYFLHFFESIFTDVERRWNDEHVAWYCPFTLRNLLSRHELTIDRCYYFSRSRKLRRLMQLLHLPCYGFLASSIVVVAARGSARD
jgi:2-polyprenyl-3-methyl-5-hydroxy-6-metoxy-1,4-benzoquinol methylase